MRLMSLLKSVICKLNCRKHCAILFRRSIMFFTFAVLQPRNSKITCTNSANSSCVLSSVKIPSAWSINPTESTPTSSSNLQTCGFSRESNNSAFEILPSCSSSAWANNKAMRSLTNCTVNVSLSVAATALTTSHKTPMSMFITVNDDNSTKSHMRAAHTGTSLPTSRTRPPRLSIKVASIKRVYIDASTVLKYSSPTFVLSASCLKAIPNTYNRMRSKHNVKNTERVAATIPRMRISNSGIARKSLTILAILESRINRAMRNMEALPRAPPAPAPPSINMAADKAQVSNTIISTKAESKTNHASLTVFRFSLNEAKRTAHSKEKYTQKKCSAIWKTGWAWINTSASFQSVSIQIQSALKAMTANVMFSKM
mmetsp:Transcript_107096/g.299795  ORF Transcript_107096/g.299795 Transcript_107096/m.299795 type:complete len:370 (+) Transcript_107096:1094-2203(+)